ncbi:MAG: glutaredoxin family protein, partial [Actinotalea sp.]|nr:glutaredoxin family protein [Actinotalea sp.]
MTSPADDDAPAGARVVLYGRAGCHLCDDARAVLADVVPADVGWAEVDVDTDPDLQARYGE